MGYTAPYYTRHTNTIQDKGELLSGPVVTEASCEDKSMNATKKSKEGGREGGRWGVGRERKRERARESAMEIYTWYIPRWS